LSIHEILEGKIKTSIKVFVTAIAMLRERAVVHGQDPELTTVSFSIDKSELNRCSILLITYGSIREDVGYHLSVKEFLKLD